MTEQGSGLRKRLPRGAFYPGSGRLRGDVVTVPASSFTADQCAFLASELEQWLPGAASPTSDDPLESFCELVIGAHAALIREAGFYYSEDPRLLRGGDKLSVAIPKIPSGTELAFELFERLAMLCAATALQGKPMAAWIGGLQQEIAKVALPIPAASHMARAAYELGMPLLEMHGTFLQVGYGACGVALSGSITEDTSSIGVHFAREKAKANALLARAGFPVADGGLVRDLPHALKRAEALGYPVVVKPADRDGGMAVSSDIRTPAEFEGAYARARAASPRVIVEKHIEGTDHRLLLYRDELLVALERTPGGVTGNGTDTILQLLDELNSDPKRGDGPKALLHRIVFDAEAKTMLRRQGLTLESVPEKGRFVPLRRAANHALGGMVRVVENIHPDNVDLARRAMKLLRLDIAGLDLILPDITRSWRETGGAICEVNAQPYIGEVIGRDYYQLILQKLVPNGGRIPLVLAIGAPDVAVVDELARTPGIAIADVSGARRDGHPLSVEGMPWLTACQAALYDCETAAALFVLPTNQAVPPLSPADRFTAALVLETPPEGFETLLQRADTIYAVDSAAPALRKAGIKFTKLDPAAIPTRLATALG